MWTLGSVPNGYGPGDDGAIEFGLSKTARQQPPTNNVPKYFPFNFGVTRDDVEDPALPGAIPDPGCGQSGSTVDLGSVGTGTLGEPAAWHATSGDGVGQAVPLT